MTQPITKAIVPAAGLGTRLLPATKSQPKEMLPVGRKPVVQYVVEELQAVGLRQILIITGRRKRAIEDHFDADPQLVSALEQAGNEAMLADLAYLEDRSRLFYTRQSPPKGLGHAISLGTDFVGDDDCVVALGDSMIAAEDPAAPLQAMMEVHRQLGAAAPEGATYDIADRIESLGGVAYDIDVDGLLAARGDDSFQYSAMGELLQAEVEDGIAISYTYDGFGRRVNRLCGRVRSDGRQRWVWRVGQLGQR